MIPSALLRAGVAGAVPASAQLTSYLTQYAAPPVVTLKPDPLTGIATYAFEAKEITRTLHPQLLGPTPAWAYDDGKPGYAGYLSPIIQIKKGTRLDVSYKNGLPNAYPARLPVDRNLTAGDTRVGILTHLHGGFVPGTEDGNPFASPSVYNGGTQAVSYRNNQAATLLWYHDHQLGATRLNVFAGLAGGYLIRDVNDTGGPGGPFDDGTPGSGNNTNNPWLPVGPYELPLVIQDRLFNAANGEFLYPVMPPGMGTTGECGKGTNYYAPGTGPWIGEYFGDEMLVNGICTPVLQVEPAVYRFRILNGCNARFLNLVLQNVGAGIAPPPKFTVIGGEQGLYGTPAVGIKELTMVNAERADVIVDFRGLAGQDLLLRNGTLPKPYASPAPRLQNIMKIQVRGTQGPAVTIPATIAGGENARFGGAAVAGTRRIVLDEWNAGLPTWFLTLSPKDFIASGATYTPLPPALTPMTPATAACFNDTDAELAAKGLTPETPAANSIEDWEFHNYTADTHPMHVHLTKFQVVDRRPLGTAPGGAGTVPPLAFERGWKDTVGAHPGMITRIRQRFELPAEAVGPQKYVYHCHIVEHEDNDMMRPYTVA